MLLCFSFCINFTFTVPIEKARLQAEAKAAEDARRRAEAEAAAESKRQRDLKREAARQALLKVINNRVYASQIHCSPSDSSDLRVFCPFAD